MYLPNLKRNTLTYIKGLSSMTRELLAEQDDVTGRFPLGCREGVQMSTVTQNMLSINRGA